MSVARFIVCERTGKWAIALRRELQTGGPRVFETRSLDDCRRELAVSPASFVAVEVTADNFETLVMWMKRLETDCPRARVAVLGDRHLEAGQWLLREVGAVQVVFSPRELGSIARMVRRHLASLPVVEDSDRQLVWRKLPWTEDSSAGSGRRH
jgi:hypothetical protein